MYAKEMVTAFIRLNGETVGAVANQPVDGESVLTRNGLEKAERFIKFCDAFAIPLLTDAYGHARTKSAPIALEFITSAAVPYASPAMRLIRGTLTCASVVVNYGICRRTEQCISSCKERICR